MDSFSSRKLIAALFGVAAVVTVAIVNAYQPIGNFVEVLKYIGGITGIAIVGQAYLDYIQSKVGTPPTTPPTGGA